MAELPERVRIATRTSPLAMWQAEYVADELRRHHTGLTVELVRIKTRGDRILDVALSKIGGKGLFIKELEEAMLDGRADIAVHSMKDVPMDMPEPFALPVICPRGEPGDAFVSNQWKSLDELPAGAVVGTSSLRRQAQIMAARPDLRIDFLRGNVGTRLGKLDSGQFDAIVLAAAGLERLGLHERITQKLPYDQCLPAVGQGAVGIECHAERTDLHRLLAPLDDTPTHTRLVAERAMNRRLRGGCEVPIAGYTWLESQTLTLEGRIGRPEGGKLIVARAVTELASLHDREAAEALGIEVAGSMLDQGAADILRDIGLLD